MAMARDMGCIFGRRAERALARRLLSGSVERAELWAPRRQRINALLALVVRIRMHTKERRRHTMKILMVLTSHDTLGNTGRKTGFWLEEFAAPYFVFRDAGVTLTLASPA